MTVEFAPLIAQYGYAATFAGVVLGAVAVILLLRARRRRAAARATKSPR
jgi:hypothetical protein